MIKNEAPSAEQWVKRGLEASRAEAIDDALQCFQRAIEAAPAYAVPHYLMGVEFAEAGRIDEAEASLARAVLLDPKLETARFQLGLLQYTAGRVAVAFITWQPLSEPSASVSLQRFAAAFQALAQDRLSDAKSLFEQGIAANRDNVPLNGDMRVMIERIQGVAGDAGVRCIRIAGQRPPCAVDELRAAGLDPLRVFGEPRSASNRPEFP